jgi:hypothetical protein
MAVLTNLALNPQPKLVSDGWTTSGGTSTWTRVSSGFAGSDDAYMELEFTADSGVAEGQVSYEHELLGEGLLSAAFQVVSSRAQVVTPLVTFFDVADSIVEVFYASDVAVPADTATVLGVAGMNVPTSATYLRITAAISLEGGSAPQLGDTLQVSRGMVSASMTVQTYGDGSYPNWGWDGAEWASTSQGVLNTSPTLVAYADWAPVPRISVIFGELHPLAASVTVQRFVGGRAHNVRGAIVIAVFGGFGVLDMEAPKDVEISYRAAQYDAAGLFIEYTGSASVTYTFPGACVHQPLDPTRNVQLHFGKDAASDIVRPFSGESFYPEGRSFPTWVGNGPRRGIESVPLDGYTLTLDQAEAMEGIFGGPDDPQLPILCIRTSGMDLPPTLFALVQQPHRIGVNRRSGREVIRWSMVGTEVSPPAEGLVVPVLTYDDLDAAYATYDERDAAYSSYLQQDTDWSLAGTADA